jgi:hypothetical protein
MSSKLMSTAMNSSKTAIDGHPPNLIQLQDGRILTS